VIFRGRLLVEQRLTSMDRRHKKVQGERKRPPRYRTTSTRWPKNPQRNDMICLWGGSTARSTIAERASRPRHSLSRIQGFSIQRRRVMIFPLGGAKADVNG